MPKIKVIPNITNHLNYISFYRNLRISGIASSFALLILLTLAVCPIVLHNNSAEASSLASTTTLTMALGSSSANLMITPKDGSGTFSSSTTSETAKFGITTNNYTGYTLTISAADDNGLLTNTDTTITTNNTLSSISSATDTATFSSSSSTALNGKWGYLPSKYNSEENITFRPAPTTTASTLDTTSIANTKKSGASSDTVDCTNYNCNDYTIGLGARIDYTKPAGNYTNIFILSAVGNPVPYAITYADDTGDISVDNLPSFAGDTSNHTQTGNISSDIVTLSSTIPTRTGYTFSSWCLGTVSSNGTVCTGTEYSSGADFGIDQTTTNTTTLYATWTINQYTCTKRYRLQNADGTFPDTYTTDTEAEEQVDYGSTCTYSKTITDYKGTVAGGTEPSTNDETGTTTATMPVGGLTLSLDFYRNTYALTINRNTTYIASTTGAGTYRWGQSVAITATAASGGAFNGWSVSSGSTGTFASASSASTTYTMPKGASTIYADGKSNCTAISGTMQAFTGTATYCSTSGTLSDSRDNQNYTVAKINNQWWMTRNLAIGCNGSGSTYGSSVSSKSLTSSNSNVSSTWSTPTALLSTSANSSSTSGYTTAAMQCNSTYGAWYNYMAATAGTISGSSNSTEASYSICPSGWRLPTNAEFSAITSSASAFSPVTGGYYNLGSLQNTSLGYW